MFSTGEFQYIQNLTQNFYNNGYKYYACITNNPIDYNNNNVYDVFCYYSDNSDLNTGIKCSFDSSNYSNNNNIDKLKCENFNTKPTFNPKEFLYSNTEIYSANIIADYEKNIKYNNDFSFYSLTILSVLVLLFLYNFISRILRS